MTTSLKTLSKTSEIQETQMEATPSAFFYEQSQRKNITIGELIDFVAQEATKKVVENLKPK